MTGPLTDVVETRAEARELDRPPLVIRQPLAAWLEGRGLGSGSLEIERVGDGLSNATFLIRAGEERLILRRPPRPPTPASTHDVLREAHVLSAVGPAGLRVPEVVATCDDETVLGAPFYLMEYIRGMVLVDDIPDVFDNDEDRQRVAEELVDALVEIHDVDWRACGLEDLGRPKGYIERQLQRFQRAWEQNKTREIPRIREVVDWLVDTVPEGGSATIVHGDFRLANAMYERESPTRLLAVLDWEMATVGDPLADLGFLTASWWEPGDRPTMYSHFSPVARAGGPGRDELVARYAERSGRPVDQLPWYRTLALWKTAVIMEGNYRRYREGVSDTLFFEGLDEGIPHLVEAAWDAASEA